MSSSHRRETCASFAIVSQVRLLSSLSFFRRAARGVCAGAGFALGSRIALASLGFAAALGAACGCSGGRPEVFVLAQVSRLAPELRWPVWVSRLDLDSQWPTARREPRVP